MSIQPTTFKLTVRGHTFDAQEMPGVTASIKDGAVDFDNLTSAVRRAMDAQSDRRIDGGWPAIRMYFADAQSGQIYTAWANVPDIDINTLSQASFEFQLPQAAASKAALRQGAPISAGADFRAQHEARFHICF